MCNLSCLFAFFCPDCLFCLFFRFSQPLCIWRGVSCSYGFSFVILFTLALIRLDLLRFLVCLSCSHVFDHDQSLFMFRLLGSKLLPPLFSTGCASYGACQVFRLALGAFTSSLDFCPFIFASWPGGVTRGPIPWSSARCFSRSSGVLFPFCFLCILA